MPVRDRVAPAVLIAALLLTGCGPGSPPPAASGTPTSTVTPDAEEAAFRAAEATYRAYVDALNAVDLSDPATFEPVFAITTGEVNEADRRNLARYHSAGLSLRGTSKVVSIASARTTDADSVSLLVCLDVASVELIAVDGSNVVDSDRAPRQSLLVTITGNSQAPLVEKIQGASEVQC